MSTPTSNDLENRLTQALTARADRVGPTDLRPAFAPHASSPWWARLRPAYVGGAVLVAAAAAVVVVAVVGTGGDDRPAPQGPAGPGVATDTSASTPSPSPEATSEPVAPTGLLPKDQPTWSDIGEPVSYDDGSTATITGDGTTIEITADGATSSVALPEQAEGGVAPFQLQLGQAGVGYLVLQSAGEFASYSVVVVRDGQAVVAAVPADVRLGSEYVEGSPTTRETWTTGNGAALFTRVLLEGPGAPADAYEVYRWEVTGPGEGGGADSAAVALVATRVGQVCFAADGSSYAEC